jgi:hypothetical protein
MLRKILTLLIINFIGFNAVAQEKRKFSRKGEFFGNWGYNRSEYSKSDIFFKGKGYEFTLHDVVATDRPTPFKAEIYFDITELTIPQYNLRFGYFFNDHWSISIGSDHMKYIMVDDQLASITGHISAQVSDPVINVNPAYVGDYNHTPFVINSHDFLIYEHSDGFNYAHVELDRYDRLWQAKNNVQGIDWLVGLGIGPLVPRTDAHLFTVGNNHDFKIAGYGISLKTGLRFDISRRFYLQTDLKCGFSRLNNVTTTGRSSDYAQQSIWFGEFYGVLGYKFGRHRAK